MYTYNSNQIKIALGSHSVSGYADDSFVSIDPHSDGILVKVGCDGDVVRAINPDKCYVVKLALLQYSPTNIWLEEQHKQDKEDGTGVFSITVKDLMGEQKFTGSEAWVSKPGTWGRGKDSTNREWEITVADGELAET